MCMLLLLKRLFDTESRLKDATLSVVTVNHNIREKEETDRDADFVVALCNRLGIKATVCVLEKGLVSKTAQVRDGGTEEAARFLRYEAFEKYAEENNISVFCLAHNQNDWYETALMRIFQGSCSISLKQRRGIFVRPLLGFTRKEIESYLAENQTEYCQDSTNADDRYLRNNLRLNVIPLLDEKIPQWKKGVEKISAALEEKYSEGKKYSLCEDENGFYVPAQEFSDSSLSQRKEMLLALSTAFGYEKRVPSVFLEDVSQEILRAFYQKKGFEKGLEGLNFSLKNNRIYAETPSKSKTDIGFFDIIRKEGEYSFPFGILKVCKQEDKVCFSCGVVAVTCEGQFPFCVRSPMTGDKDKKALFLVEKI